MSTTTIPAPRDTEKIKASMSAAIDRKSGLRSTVAEVAAAARGFGKRAAGFLRLEKAWLWLSTKAAQLWEISAGARRFISQSAGAGAVLLLVTENGQKLVTNTLCWVGRAFAWVGRGIGRMLNWVGSRDKDKAAAKLPATAAAEKWQGWMVKADAVYADKVCGNVANVFAKINSTENGAVFGRNAAAAASCGWIATMMYRTMSTTMSVATVGAFTGAAVGFLVRGTVKIAKNIRAAKAAKVETPAETLNTAPKGPYTKTAAKAEPVVAAPATA